MAVPELIAAGSPPVCHEVRRHGRTQARPGVRGPGSAGSPRIRLTGRGRLVARALVAAAFGLLVAGAVLLVNRPAAAGTHARPVPVSYHVVLPGETLLEIAAGVDPGADARDTAVRIVRLNALDGWGLQAGQRLALPVDAGDAGG